MENINLQKLTEKYDNVTALINKLFGESDYFGDVQELMSDLLYYAKWANGIIETAKTTGAYDAVMHERDKELLKKARQEIKRLRSIVDVAIAIKYMNSILEIGNQSFYGRGIEFQAESQLRDRVNSFLDTFKEEKE